MDEAPSFVAPPIPLEAAVEALRGLDSGLDYLLDSIWETNETQFANKIENGIKTTSSLLYKMLDDMPANEEDQRAFASSYLDGESPDGGRRDVINYQDIESGQVMLHRLTQEEVISGINTIRSFLRELGDELLNFSRDEIEEVSDLVLAVARIWVQMAQGATRNVLRVLEKDYKWEEDEKLRREQERGQVIEEATDDEIAELYRKRGEEPPPPSQRRMPTPDGMVNSNDDGEGERSWRKRNNKRRMSSRRRPKPQRVLWKPIRPRLVTMARQLPQFFQDNPIKIGGTVALLLPFSGLILFCLPGALLTDHCLQTLYDKYSEEVEVAVDNGKQMGKLGFVVVRLSARQGYRVLRRQLRKVEADPANVAKEVGNTLYEAVSHPRETAKTLYNIGVDGVSSTISWLSWARDQLQAMNQSSQP